MIAQHYELMTYLRPQGTHYYHCITLENSTSLSPGLHTYKMQYLYHSYPSLGKVGIVEGFVQHGLLFLVPDKLMKD